MSDKVAAAYAVSGRWPKAGINARFFNNLATAKTFIDENGKSVSWPDEARFKLIGWNTSRRVMACIGDKLIPVMMSDDGRRVIIDRRSPLNQPWKVIAECIRLQTEEADTLHYLDDDKSIKQLKFKSITDKIFYMNYMSKAHVMLIEGFVNHMYKTRKVEDGHVYNYYGINPITWRSKPEISLSGWDDLIGYSQEKFDNYLWNDENGYAYRQRLSSRQACFLELDRYLPQFIGVMLDSNEADKIVYIVDGSYEVVIDVGSNPYPCRDIYSELKVLLRHLHSCGMKESIKLISTKNWDCVGFQITEDTTLNFCVVPGSNGDVVEIKESEMVNFVKTLPVTIAKIKKEETEMPTMKEEREPFVVKLNGNVYQVKCAVNDVPVQFYTYLLEMAVSMLDKNESTAIAYHGELVGEYVCEINTGNSVQYFGCNDGVSFFQREPDRRPRHELIRITLKKSKETIREEPAKGAVEYFSWIPAIGMLVTYNLSSKEEVYQIVDFDVFNGTVFIISADSARHSRSLRFGTSTSNGKEVNINDIKPFVVRSRI